MLADSAQSGCIRWCHLALTDGHTEAESGICWRARSMSENSQRRQYGRGGGTHLQHGVVEALAPLLQRDIQAAVDLVKLLQALPVTQPSDPMHPEEAQAVAVQPRDLEQWRRMRSSTLDRGIPACWHPGTSVGNISRRSKQLNGLRTLRLMAHSSFQAARNAGSPDCSLVTASRARALKSSSSSNRFFDSLHIGKDACSRPISAQKRRLALWLQVRRHSNDNTFPCPDTKTTTGTRNPVNSQHARTCRGPAGRRYLPRPRPPDRPASAPTCAV